MASDPDSAAATSFLEQLINSRNRDISSFLPLILGFSRSRRPQQDSDDEEDNDNDNDGGDSVDQARGRIVLINPLTQGMIVIESSRSLEDMIREFASKEGPKPASKSSIEAMPKVIVTEDDREKECPICIEDWVIGEEAREMPCRHKYHGKCIEKWLGMHGSCPVCRHKMPVDEDDQSRKVSDGGEGGRRGEIWVSFATFGSRRESTTNGSSDAQNVQNDDSSESS